MTNVPHKHADIIHAYADGATIQWRPNSNSEWMTPQYPDFDPSCEYRIKPYAPKYPETQMVEADFLDIGVLNMSPQQQWTAVANAAIAHAISDGQVVVPTDHEVMPDRLTQYSTHIINQGRIFGTRKVIDYVSNRLLDAPDMVPTTMLDRVARAVYLACDSIMVDMYNDTALQGIDLTAIIASVKAGVA